MTRNAETIVPSVASLTASRAGALVMTPNGKSRLVINSHRWLLFIWKAGIPQMSDKQEEIFKQWLGEHKNLIFRLVKAYASSPQDRDDLFQQILLQLWSSIPGFQGNAAQKTWIYRVALNTALVWRRSQIRKLKRHRKLIIDFNEASDVQQTSSETMRDTQILDELYGAIRQLPKIDSSIVLMYLDGVSYEEMAEILGISRSNVGVRLNRAKKKLAQLLKGLIDEV